MTMIQIPAGVIVNESKAIVSGKVESISYEKISNVIYTNYTFKINTDGYIKPGTITGDTINIKTIGGQLGKEKLDVPGFPVLLVNNDYVLFLEKRGNNYNIYGANQGCLKVTEDANSTKIVTPCENRYFNSIYINQNSSGKVTLKSFIKKIQEYQTN